MLRPAVVITLLGVAPAALAGGTWTRRTVPGHEVSVELPGPAEHRQKERSMFIGTVVTDTVVSRDADGWCAATVTTVPKLALRFAGEDKVLATARDNVLEDYAGRQLSWRPVTRDGHDGMRLEFSTSRDASRPETGLAEFFTYDGKIVTMVTLHARSMPSTAVERMFASVDLGDE